MGACDFTQVGPKGTLKESFTAAHEKAAWEHGHGGYSGTLAEKGDTVQICTEQVEEGAAYTLAHRLIQEYDERINDKWGPAGAIPLTDGRWLFFGMASS